MDIKRTVHGVGYVGVGRHIISVKGMRTHTYMTWYNMMTRCYCKKLHQRLPQYAVCEVSEDWKNFQNFAEWYESHELHGLGYHLDKDLLVRGNTTYSVERCCLIPQELNKLITAGRFQSNNLQGVNWSKQSKTWRASVNLKGKSIHLGFFATDISAHEAYVKAKEAIVREAAIEWRDRIMEATYSALTNWKFKHA